MKFCFEILYIKEDKWIGHYSNGMLEYHDIGEKSTVYGTWHYIAILPCIVIKWFKRKK